MIRKIALLSLLVLFLLTGVLRSWRNASATPPENSLARPAVVSAFDLILAMNTLRVSNGLPALIEDPIVNAVAQGTAEIMAANQMSWHIGNVRGRLQSAGYGGGAQVWATENFAVGSSMSIDQIMLAWADPDHMRPAVNPAYCHVGAGVATAANGRTYYVLQAAYISGQSCGDYTSPGGGDGSGANTGINPVPQIIVPVKIATPDQDGKIYHVVEPGQSFWAIAIAYQITIKDLEFWNNLSRERKLQVGQQLFIPSSSTEGYATPTPVGMVVPSPPDSDGKIVHTVESYHTLISISKAYEVPLDTIVALNGIQIDWPLQIGQKLLISPGNVTPSPTPRPLTPLEQLTPDGDGNYYHTVQSGETLFGIAGYYEIPLSELLAWNGLNVNSIIRPEQKLRLEVTPPTPTPSPSPSPAKMTATLKPSATLNPTQPPITATQTSSADQESEPTSNGQEWLIGLVLSLMGLSLLIGVIIRRKV